MVAVQKNFLRHCSANLNHIANSMQLETVGEESPSRKAKQLMTKNGHLASVNQVLDVAMIA